MRALGTGARAAGAAAIGAIAIGAVAVGRLRVGNAAAKKLSVGRLEVDELVIGGNRCARKILARDWQRLIAVRGGCGRARLLVDHLRGRNTASGHCAS